MDNIAGYVKCWNFLNVTKLRFEVSSIYLGKHFLKETVSCASEDKKAEGCVFVECVEMKVFLVAIVNV